MFGWDGGLDWDGGLGWAGQRAGLGRLTEMVGRDVRLFGLTGKVGEAVTVG